MLCQELPNRGFIVSHVVVAGTAERATPNVPFVFGLEMNNGQ
jgi:hypothetical protein